MDIYIKGFSFTQTITLLDGKEIADTSDYSSITMKIRRLGDDTLLKSFALSDLTLESPSTSGKVTFALSASDIEDAKAGAYECEIGTKLPGESREREVVYVFILEEPYE